MPIALKHRNQSSLSTIRVPSRVSHALEWFLVVEFVCQLALLVQSLASFRVVFRCAAFGVSLGFLFLFPPGKRFHPSTKVCLLALVLVGLAAFHPTTNSALSATMQFLLYAAVAAPLIWVSNLELDKAEIRRALLMMLVFQAISSFVGILQVYFPGQFRGATSIVIASQSRSYLRGLYYRNSFGQMVMRPSGLTDIPGGVNGAGQYTVLLSLYFLLTERKQIARIASAAAAIVGVAAVYLSGVKAGMICLVLSMCVFVALFFWRSLTTLRLRAPSASRRRRVSAIQVCALSMTIAIVGYLVAFNVGGEGVLNATQTLTQSAPGQLFYQERGRFLEYTLEELLPQFPFGAGLGRWGMMRYYFGDPANLNSPAIWVEIQWTAWLLDGGVPLVITYAMALTMAVIFALRCAVNVPIGDLAVLSALIAAYDVSVAAATFDSVPFIGGTGVEFWMLNAMLFGAIMRAYEDVRLGYSLGGGRS
jgi:hypothetical protein